QRPVRYLDAAVDPPIAILRLYRDRGGWRASPVAGLRQCSPALCRPFCDAAYYRARRYLPGVPRTVPEAGVMRATAAATGIIDMGSEWTFTMLEQYEREIARIAADFRLDTYPNQIEVISSEQMMDAYASSGMPINYHHWSFGKRFIQVENQYRRGALGLAYEIVINSNPCIAYLMEENTSTLQAMVIAHACFGHNSFFKNNYLFRTWTDAESIIDYLVFARKFVRDCEERHGVEAVEAVLDACHTLMDHGVDRYKRPYPSSMEEEERRQLDREEHLQRQVNDLWRTIPVVVKGTGEQSAEVVFPSEPQENLLYFIEK